jgi:hypothetical protein
MAGGLRRFSFPALAVLVGLGAVSAYGSIEGSGQALSLPPVWPGVGVAPGPGGVGDGDGRGAAGGYRDAVSSISGWARR